jgi:hypothetical protein
VGDDPPQGRRTVTARPFQASVRDAHYTGKWRSFFRFGDNNPMRGSSSTVAALIANVLNVLSQVTKEFPTLSD